MTRRSNWKTTADEPASQREVLEFYKEHAPEAASVGDYVRVVPGTSKKTCFGPLEDGTSFGWQVVEIDWQHGAFLLAPIKERDIDD